MAKVWYIKFFFVAFIIFTLLTPTFNAKSIVTIDSKNRLIVDGKPIFPNGIYMSYVYTDTSRPYTDENLDRVHDAGFNLVLSYGECNGTAIEKHGLKSVYGLSAWYGGGFVCEGKNYKSWDEYFNSSAKELTAWKNSSSLIGWYIGDELNQQPRTQYINASCLRHNIFNQMDPNHPCISIMNGALSVKTAELLKDCTDIIGFAYYPNGIGSCQKIYNQTIEYRKLVNNRKPVWIVAQLCRYSENGTVATFPRLNELRLEAYLALIAKADGLIWWDYWDMSTNWTSCKTQNNKRVCSSLSPSDPVFLQRWSNATNMAKEVQFMSPVLLGGIDYDPLASNTSILTRGLLYNGSSYVLVANPKGVENSVIIKPITNNWSMQDVAVKYGNLSVAEKESLLQIMAPPYESGLIILKGTGANLVPTYNLTGVWDAKLGGVYYLRQIGNNLYWYGEEKSTNYPPRWSNIAFGTINGDMINLSWADVPKGKTMNNGTLVMRVTRPVEGLTVLRVERQTGGFSEIMLRRFDYSPFMPP